MDGGDDAGSARDAGRAADASRRDASSRDAGSPDGGPPETGDRYVSPTGADEGDCASDPCLTFAYAGEQMSAGETLVVMEGTYPDSIGNDTFPRGSEGDYTRIVAEHDGMATVTGGITLFEDSEFYLELAGLRFVDADEKRVAGGHVSFFRVSFVGGPARGNVGSLTIGTNEFEPGAWDVVCEGCLFYGLGGRYSVLTYRATRVTLRDIVARKDGGWGLIKADTDGEQPEGVVIFYESSETLCERCVVLDSLHLGVSSPLGALINNSHEPDLSVDSALESCIAIDNDYAGLTFEGRGRVNDARVSNCYSAHNSSNGITINLAAGGDIAIDHTSVSNNGGDGIADYSDDVSVSLDECSVQGNAGEQLRGVPGDEDGAGAPAIDLSGFDSARIRRELCDGVSRGFCASDLPFAEYVVSRL
jgi:hypothetical protein